ncbi:hypothetical protein ABNIH3_06401, partial [Acinetobacter baumannii ABNIH3]
SIKAGFFIALYYSIPIKKNPPAACRGFAFHNSNIYQIESSVLNLGDLLRLDLFKITLFHFYNF